MSLVLRPLLRLGALFLACGAVVSCASSPVLVSQRPPAQYEKLGQASGTACGTLGLGGTAYYFFPVLLNSRVERARTRALESKPGATALIDTQVDEYWFWWAVGTTRCTTFSGEAIR